MRNLYITLAGIFLLALNAQAGMAEIKQAMAQRLSAINKLKDELTIGEDNAGYLAARKELKTEDTALINAENADRKIAYQTLAAKTGTTVEKVGTRRAAQIAELSQPGLWLQKPDGTWYKKQPDEEKED